MNIVARRIRTSRLLMTALLSSAALLVSVLCGGAAAAPNTARLSSQVAPPQIIPAPASLKRISGTTFALQRTSRIVVATNASTALPVARYFAAIAHRSTGYPLSISRGNPKSSRHDIAFYLIGSGGQEGYRLDVTKTSVRLGARTPEGLFRGVQTLRQLFPAKVESAKRQSGPWQLPGVHIVDHPRFEWRGVMPDVSRHFFGVATVKRLIDGFSLYKINVLHLHLTDDQGWRIQIDSWPNLTTIGGSTAYGGAAGGYYTKSDYSAIVRYAASRYMTVVPEIDGPGHLGSALASYPELNCNGVAPPLITFTPWPTTSLCLSKEITYQFLDDVVREIAALTPGPYIHIAGDETWWTPVDQTAAFVARAEQIVQAHGKKAIGWLPNADNGLALPTSVGELWYLPISGVPSDATQSASWYQDSVRAAVGRGMKVILSPTDRAFLNSPYLPQAQSWMTHIEVRDSYDWDPATYADFVVEKNVLGVEALLWAERILTVKDIEYQAFPRLPALAEVGWSPAGGSVTTENGLETVNSGRSWSEFRLRLAAQAPRWRVMGVNFYRSPQVQWK